jgi:hypothetical protein
MARNSVLLSTLQLGAFTIPLSGEDVVWSITKAARAEISDSVNGDAIANMIPYDRATLTVTAYPTHPAHAILRSIASADDLAGGGLPLAGAAVDGSSAQVATWGGAKLTQEADMRAAKTITEGSFVFELSRCRFSQSLAGLLLAQAGS